MKQVEIMQAVLLLHLALLRDEKDQGIMTMKRAMMKSLEDRYSKVEENPLCAIVTVLDPRFKQRDFLISWKSC